jgi:membrane protease YdiL (CAAX protease family)
MNNERSDTAKNVLFLLCLHCAFVALQAMFLVRVQDVQIRALLSKVFLVLACAVPTAFYRFGGGERHIRRRLRINCMPAVPMFFISLAIMCGALLINTKLCELLKEFGASYSVGNIAVDFGESGLVFAIVTYVVLPTVCEELFFRYALLGSLGGGLYAVIISALCFSVVQFNPYGSVYTLTEGLVLGCAAIATGSLLLPMLLHGTMNALALALSYLSSTLDPVMYIQLESIVWSVIFLGGIVFSVFTLLNFNRQQNVLFNLEKDTDKPAESRNKLTVILPILYIAALTVWNLLRMVF